MIRTANHIPANLVNSTLGIARSIPALKCLRPQKGHTGDVDTRCGCNDRIGFRRVRSTVGVVNGCPRCRTTHCDVLSLKIKALFWTKGGRRNLRAQYKIDYLCRDIGVGITSTPQLSATVTSKAPDCPIARHGNAVTAGTHNTDSNKIANRYCTITV